MSLLKLAKQSLVFYWRTNLGVLLSIIVSTSVLTGALVIGDSVRYTLAKLTDDRLGPAKFALFPKGRFFSSNLSNNLEKELGTKAAPVLQLNGMISNDNGSKRVSSIEVLGVDDKFYDFSQGENPFIKDSADTIVLNKPLAARLNTKVGEDIVLRIEKPSAMSRDVPLTPDSDLSIAFRLRVAAIADEADFGRFSLQANQVWPLNAFVPMQWLQKKIDRIDEANIILISDNKNIITIDQVNKAVKKIWRLADAELELNQYDLKGVFEIRSRRVFIDDVLSQAALNADANSVGILTYFVNEIRLRDKFTPYSFVSAIQPSAVENGIIPDDMKDDEIIINQWLADDIGANVGDSIELKYYVQMPMRKLEEKSAGFKVRIILPIQGVAIDSELMPDFPGLADAENCRDWEPGIEIDLDKIRDKDEKYWDDYKGTPKAFVTLSAGQKIWANRYGNITGVRYPIDNLSESDIAQKILKKVEPASVGLFFMPVRELGGRAGGGTDDFGQLFLGLSMFLIIASLILTGLVFVFGVESRSEQIGMLMAVGLPQKLIKRLLMAEGAILAILGAAIGTLAAVLYTKAIIFGLATIWKSIAGGSEILYHAKQSTMLAGAMAAVIFSMIAVWITLRKSLKRPARELLAGALRWQYFKTNKVSKSRIGLLIAAVSALGAMLIVSFTGAGDSKAVSGAFFGAGALLLISGLSLSYALLKMVAGRWNRAVSSLVGLGLRNSTRRSGRSLAVIGLLACGIFLVIAIGVFRQNPDADAHRRDSGTGGFALYGESTIGLLYDLNTESGRKSLRLNESDFKAVDVVQLRVHDGDDASCLNLNQAQMPRILGVQPQLLNQRGAFGVRQIIQKAVKNDAWLLLEQNISENVVPAIGDYATVFWALGKSVGDEIDYVDEKGSKIRLFIVGILNSSILQGSLLISENEFIKRFPSDEGYRTFLIDAPRETSDEFSNNVMSRLRDYGFELIPASQRLEQFMVVENTYLSIFQLLGGLGMILGSIGLGLVVLRNVLERRGELAMLQAVGYNKTTLKKMIFHEHGGLMLYGLLCGIIAALVAVAPALRTTSANVPYLTIAAIGINAVLWIWIAASFALSGRLMDALRNE
ncbi:MAG: FtsX-like permease family protein [Sedimentisphaerales bacterium]|nr:FtsX-like permease family protein [Sedimentisphaerales bacterium]